MANIQSSCDVIPDVIIWIKICITNLTDHKQMEYKIKLYKVAMLVFGPEFQIVCVAFSYRKSVETGFLMTRLSSLLNNRIC